MAGPTTGLSVRTRTREKRLAGGIQGSSITVVSLVLISERELVGVEICANMLMGCLSVGCTQHNIELGFARMA